MIMKLTSNDANVLKEYNKNLYHMNYINGHFHIPNSMRVSKIKTIWPNKQLKLI